MKKFVCFVFFFAIFGCTKFAITGTPVLVMFGGSMVPEEIQVIAYQDGNTNPHIGVCIIGGGEPSYSYQSNELDNVNFYIKPCVREWIELHRQSFDYMSSFYHDTYHMFYVGTKDITITADVEIEGRAPGVSLNDLFNVCMMLKYTFGYPSCELLSDDTDTFTIEEYCSSVPIFSYFYGFLPLFDFMSEQAKKARFTVEFTLIDNEFHDGEFTIKGTSKLHSEL